MAPQKKTKPKHYMEVRDRKFAMLDTVPGIILRKLAASGVGGNKGDQFLEALDQFDAYAFEPEVKAELDAFMLEAEPTIEIPELMEIYAGAVACFMDFPTEGD